MTSRIVRIKIPSALLTLTFLLIPRTWATTTGTVQGSVIDDSGLPVVGAHVLINRALPAGSPQFTAPPVVTGPLAANVTADANGKFSVQAMPPGEYVACAEAIAPGLLNPCLWAASAPAFTVTAGNVTANVDITMTRGAVVPIHVNDPQSLLQPVAGSSSARDFQVHAVTGKGLHYRASVRDSSVNSRDLAVTIPFGAAVTLQVLTTHLKVNDRNGNPVSKSGSSLTVASGDSPATMEFTIVGIDSVTSPAIPGIPGLQ